MNDPSKPPPPTPKPRTIFNVPKDEPVDEEVAYVMRKTPPPRPPLPSRITSTSPVEPPPEKELPPPPYVENVVYLRLDTYRALDPSLSSSTSPVSPKTRPAPPPPPVQATVGWNIPSVPPPPRPLPPLPPSVIESDCSPSTSRCNSIDESTGSIDKTELADSFEVLEESMVADGHFICFAGYVTLQTEKKKKRAHARLRNSKLAFYIHEEVDDTQGKAIMGPHNLNDLLFITFIGQNISMYFMHDDDAALVRFTPENEFDSWILMLGESILADMDLLRSSLRGWNSLGRAWTRKGAVGEWKKCVIAMHEHTLYSLENEESLFLTDLRKVHALKFKVDKLDWCSEIKRKGQEGPTLLTLDGSSLAIEADFSVCTKEWKDAIDAMMRRPQNTLEDCRLSSNGVPIAIEKCITFISTHGLELEGIYRKNGNKSKEKALLKLLVDDAWSVHLTRECDECVFAVADVLRQFLRRMETAVIPENLHQDFYAILLESDASIRDSSLIRLLDSLPQVHYLTLRRVIAHLCEVTANSSRNKATIENVAKMFGPTLFYVDSCDVMEKQAEMGQQISVVVLLIHRFAHLFRETAREAASKAVLESAKKDVERKTNKTRAEGMLVSISLWPGENRAFNVREDLVAQEVLTQAFALRDIERDANVEYAVFEVLNEGSLCRRLHEEEKISSIVLDRWLRWKIGGDAYLRVDRDPHPLSRNLMSPFTGKVKVALDGSRWFQSCELRIEGGSTIVMCTLKSLKTIRKWEISDLVVFEGSTRKPGHESALTFIPLSTSGLIDKYTGICVHFKQEDCRIRFLNSVLVMYAMEKPNLLVHF
ncbi:hypothetical protein PFISCL1PPCAC_10539 [Pristionchus fissidentatus]|uniref:Rho-GAP domain-containing protein n=1 Tax=Pristionchus fissidentatus TaxID=1538716 RepID=A0AAV5VMI0_9BILA|nr:hypothetical protein PFISCL1PPCAC_10539 [Pristionchus fissidentatus]